MKENGYDLYNSGLRIYTTIDTVYRNMQSKLQKTDGGKCSKLSTITGVVCSLGAILRAMKSQDSLRLLLNVSPSIRS